MCVVSVSASVSLKVKQTDSLGFGKFRAITRPILREGNVWREEETQRDVKLLFLLGKLISVV